MPPSFVGGGGLSRALKGVSWSWQPPGLSTDWTAKSSGCRGTGGAQPRPSGKPTRGNLTRCWGSAPFSARTLSRTALRPL